MQFNSKRITCFLILVTFCLFTIGCNSDVKISPTNHTETQPGPAMRTHISSDTDKEIDADSLPFQDDIFVEKRDKMVDSTIESRGISNPDVLLAIREVKRHLFVPEKYKSQAYADHPIPIGYGQTISQPYIVALMTELLELSEGERVLEIGTGSGYQAAVLAELGYVDVYSIEIIPELAASASELLNTVGYENVNIKHDDGYFGWRDYAPFDAIVVTAAPDHLPAPLVEQLKDGGRLVVPIGPPGGYQTLWKFVKTDGNLKAYNMGGVAFVPFTGEGIGQAGD